MKFVSIIIGSKSDYDIMKACEDVLERFEVQYELIISSAHRSAKRTKEYVLNAEKKGAKVFIAGAGMAAHLAGAISALSTKPVIGVPLKGGAIDGLDALLSTLQMPRGMPVATVALNGAVNAAYLAVQILALNDESLQEKLNQDRLNQIEKLELDSKKIEKILKV